MTSITERTSQEERSKVSCHVLWAVVLWTNTEETKVLQKRGLSLGCIELEPKKKTKTLISTLVDIVNCLHLNVVNIYFVSDL